MNLAHVVEAVVEVSGELPVPVLDLLDDVEVRVCELAPCGMPSDVRGVYEGNFSSGLDDEAEQEPPSGRVTLVAANLADKGEARAVYLHEIAHALGLDEHEVSGLGL